MSDTDCWLCGKPHGVEEGEIGHCQHCFIDIDRVPYKLHNEKEENVGRLSEIAKQRSPFLRLAIGESSEPLTYKNWKEISGQFGDSFRYIFELETPNGIVTKSFDCPQQRFAEQMDTFPFDSKIIIHRRQKVDANGNAILDKSVYEAEMIK